MEILVGYTGFVGSNLCQEHHFDGLYASHNVSESYGTNPDLLVYSGVPAQKFLANKDPEKDFKIIEGAIENIKKIQPKKLVLISTIDVYERPIEVDEETQITPSKEAYGRNRRYLEEWVIKNIPDYLIVRLPGLFGENIKKNFIYDLIHYVPSMLKKEKYAELVKDSPILDQYYHEEDNGFYKCRELNKEEHQQLKEVFQNLHFSALNFTDSRATFQFYNLKNLWHDIEIALENHLKIVNLATEPVSIEEIYQYICQESFHNEITQNPPNYNYKSKYASIYHGKNGYLYEKEEILDEIKEFVLKKTRS